MATAVTFGTVEIPGMVLKGVSLPPRQVQNKTRKYWGLNGESRINGGTGGRTIRLPILLYDDETDPEPFDTARKLSDYIKTTLGDLQGTEETMSFVSESDHDEFASCVFEGFELSSDGVVKDYAGTLGGGFFAMGTLVFRQL